MDLWSWTVGFNRTYQFPSYLVNQIQKNLPLNHRHSLFFLSSILTRHYDINIPFCFQSGNSRYRICFFCNFYSSQSSNNLITSYQPPWKSKMSSEFVINKALWLGMCHVYVSKFHQQHYHCMALCNCK